MSFFDDASLVFLPSGQAGKDGKAYSMKPTNGNGDFTFSRGSNLTATRVDSNGLIEKGRENLLLQSNQFDTTWTTDGASVTSGQSGYDGSSDAWKLSGTGGSFPRVQQNKSISGVSTFSVYAKAGNVNVLRLLTISGSNTDVKFQLTGSGSVLTQTGSERIESKITRLGSTDWYRCSITFNGSPTNFRIYPMSDSSTFAVNGEFVYIQDAQLEIGLTSTEYIESGASTGLAGILEDSPRFDYSGGASCPSLLLESQRSNIVGFTEYLEGTNWGVGGSTGLQLRTSITSPDGNNGVYLVTSEAGNTSSRVQYNLGTLGNDHIFSVFIKGTGSATRIRLRNNTASINSVVYDIDSSGNFTLNAQSAHDGYYGVDDYGNGWHRVYLKVDTNGGGNNFMQIYSDVVDADGSIYVWGAQAEDASYISSYIPNHSGGSVTRNADSSTLSSIINGDAAFTFMIESGIQDYGSSVPKYFDAGSLGYINHNTSNTLRYRFGGSNYVQSISGLDSFKFLLRYDRSEIKVYFNGSLEHTISASLSGSIGLSLLGGLNKQVLLFPSDLPDNQCITLTS